MFELKQTEMQDIIELMYEDTESGVRFTVKNRKPSLDWCDYQHYCNSFDKDYQTLFGDGHFAELTETPLDTYRRWDAMQYFMSYSEQLNMVQCGYADLFARLIKSVYRNKPAGQVVVILAMGSPRNYLSEDYIENYLGAGMNANKDSIKYICNQNKADNLGFVAITDDPERAEENTARLFNCMMDYGMTRMVEGEYVPTEFVVITESMTFFSGPKPHPVAMQKFFSKGIRFIEHRHDTAFSCGIPLLNRKSTSGILYFPIEDRYLKSTGIEYRNYYVPSSIHDTDFRNSRSLSETMNVIVPTEEKVFPIHTVQRILYAMIEQNMTVLDSDPNGYVLLFMSTEANAFDMCNLRYILDVPYGEIDTLPYDTNDIKLIEALKKYDAYNSRKYLFYHIANHRNVPKHDIERMAHLIKDHGFHLVPLQTHPNETRVYEDTKKFFK